MTSLSNNPTGRPPKYKSPLELDVLIQKYFQEIDEHNKTHPLNQRPYTITGLALALDLTRKGLIEYSHKSDEFGNTVKAAKSRVERFAEEMLYRTGQVTGVIFNLKNNFGWKDQSDVNLGGQNGENPIDANLSITFVKPAE